MKKVKAILLAAAMMVSLASCSVKESEKSKEQGCIVTILDSGLL